MSQLDVRIGEVVTDMVLTEAVGSLAPEEVRRLIQLVIEQLQRNGEYMQQRSRDVAIGNSAYHSLQG